MDAAGGGSREEVSSSSRPGPLARSGSMHRSNDRWMLIMDRDTGEFHLYDS